MRVMTCNIWDGGADRLPLIAAVIRSQSPGVVALQEANSHERAEELARALGMRLVFGEANNGYHVAWLSRLPITYSHNHRLPALSKTLLEIEVTWEGAPCRLFATHLASRHDGGEERVASEMRAIVELLRDNRASPHLLVGDFNTLAPGDMLTPERPLSADVAERAEREYARPRLSIPLLLAAGYVDCYRALHPEQSGYTYRSDAPLARIDYIFASPQMARRLRACERVEGELAGGASDHLPVWADFA